jgi:hypothetical protein
VSSFLTTIDEVHNFFDTADMGLGTVFQISCALFIFPNVKLCLLELI